MAVMGYSIDMKRRMTKRRGKMNRGLRGKRQGKRPHLVFLITFCMVVTVGLAGLFLMKGFVGKSVERKEAEKKTDTWPAAADSGESGGTLTLFGERIPERGKEAADPHRGRENAEGAGDGAEAEPEPAGRYAAELADEEYLKENRILPWEAGSDEEVTLGFVGDILFDDEYAIMASLKSRGGALENGISPALLEKMREVDIMVVNNEFPYTNRGTPTEGKTFTFRADVDTVAYLRDMGTDVAILANNHLYDFGETGLLDTLDTLEGAGIPGVGAGRNIKEASAPLYFIVNDIKIAIVAATQIERLENPDTKGATENSAGVFRCLNPQKLYETVARAKENSDFVIVYIHWGTEFMEEPDWAQLEQGPGLAAAGADLIIGDHPHCLQGIAYIDGVPAIYSLGNFWFNSRTADSCMVRVTIGREGLKAFQFIPAIQSGCRVDLAYDEEKARILDYMRSLSPGVSIDGEGYIGAQD